MVGCLLFIGYATVQYQDRIVGFFFGEPKSIVQLGSMKVFVKVADESHEQIKGLSGTTGLGELEAMLFVFDTVDKHGIWMKDMNYPIDIFWISDDERIIHIEKDVNPNTYPKSFKPKEPARYVIETNADFADTFNVTVGQDVVMPDWILKNK